MNQHITKLVRQVLKECVSIPVESVIASRIDDHGIVEIPNTFAEKFAQLIIQDCYNVIIKSQRGHFNPITSWNACKQHFGVEE